MKSIPKTLQLVVDANWILSNLVGYNRDWKKCVNQPRWIRLQRIMGKTRVYWSDDAADYLEVIKKNLDPHRNAYHYDEIVREIMSFQDPYGDKIKPHIEGAYKWL